MLGPHGHVPSPSRCAPASRRGSSWQLPSATSATQSGEPVKPKATVQQHWELQPDCRGVGVPVHGRWLCRGACGGMHPPCWRRPPPEPPLSPAVSQIVTQDYCEAVQQLELEQDLRLHAEAFAHEVQQGSPCSRVLGGRNGTTGTHRGWESGGAACSQCPSMQTARYSAHCWLRPLSQEGGDAPRHPSRSPGTPGMRSDGFCSQPPRKGFFSHWGKPGGSVPP